MAEKTVFQAPVRAQRCENCVHFADEVFQRLPATCRINPPTVIPVPGPGGQAVLLGMWAPTDARYWCSAWRENPSNSN